MTKQREHLLDGAMPFHKDSLRMNRAACLVLGLLAVLRAMFIFVPAPQFWGINFFAFLPEWLAIVLSALSIAVVVRAMMDKGMTEDSRTARFNIFSLKWRIVISICAGVLFFLCAIPFALLGDGGLFLGDLYRYVLLGQAVPLYREPLTMLLNSRLCALIYPLQQAKEIIVTYRISGAVFGAVYIATVMKFASSIRASYGVRIIAFVLFATCGGVLLFFGYVENYAPQYAFDVLYIALLIQMFRANGSPVWAGVVLIFCCLLHLQNVLLIPSFAVALAMQRAVRKGTGHEFGVKVYKYTAIALPVLLVVYTYFQWRPVARLETGDNPFIPFFAVGGLKYTLFSPMHVVDILNEQLLLAPVALALLALMILVARKHIRWTSPELVCAAVATIAFEAFLFGGNLLIGLGRDWDVVASLGAMITFIAVLVLEQVSPFVPYRSRTTIAVCVVALTGMIGWVAVNVDDIPAIERYTSLLQYHRPAVLPIATRYGYESLRKVYFNRQDWENELATDAVMLEVLPWHIDLAHTLTIATSHAGDTRAQAGNIVARIVSQLMRTQSDSTLCSEVAGDERNVRIAAPGAYPASLGDLIIMGALNLNRQLLAWTDEQTMAFADTLIALHPSLPYGYELEGTLHFIARDTLAAAAMYRKSAEMDDHRANSLVILALLYQASGTWDSVRAISKQVLLRDQGNYEAANMLYIVLKGMPLTSVDIPDLALLENAEQTFLQGAKDHNISSYQIKQANSILSTMQSEIKKLKMMDQTQIQ